MVTTSDPTEERDEMSKDETDEEIREPSQKNTKSSEATDEDIESEDEDEGSRDKDQAGGNFQQYRLWPRRG